MSVKRYEWVACDEHSCHCDVVESAEGNMVDYEDYAALEARCAVLTAENALLKKSEPAPFSKLMMDALDVYLRGADEVPELAMLSAYKKLRDGLKTPATDAFLAEVRAQGVEMLNTQFKKCTGMLYADSVVSTAEHFAAQLRQEAAQ
ncbi:hypothetical protein [Enterobacter cloacae complex sp. P31C]|uniref:hypothetical protein n=1 Tax=Enterobacter cloacae complex sp. P31C TaxID=2779560 RepID=UPI001D0213E5|nr:hypothetical protein [Enterobacter cloacae complex sp. P31C]